MLTCLSTKQKLTTEFLPEGLPQLIGQQEFKRVLADQNRYLQQYETIRIMGMTQQLWQTELETPNGVMPIKKIFLNRLGIEGIQ